MRNAMILGGAVGALMFASFGGIALAANSNPNIALSSRLGATSCASFTHMGKARQERLVRRMIAAGPARSLASTKSAMSGDASSDTSSGQTPAAGPLQPSDLAAACQAATGTATLEAAYAKFSTGAGISADH
jgi:hypothetical protein